MPIIVFSLVFLQVPSGVGHFGLCDRYEVHFAAIRTCFADDLLRAKAWAKCLHASFRSGPSGRPSSGWAVQDDQKLVLGRTDNWLSCHDGAWVSVLVCLQVIREYWYVVGP